MFRWLLVFLVMCCGCWHQKPDNQLLKISFSIYPTTIDPRKSSDFISSSMVCLLYDGLMRCNGEGGVEPAMAERVEISKNRKRYTFYLRKAFWSDGELVRATDFERSWKQQLDPGFPSYCGYLLYPIVNAEAAAKGLVSVDEVGVRAVDERTLVVELEHPAAHFLELTAYPSLLPIAQHAPAELEVSRRVVNGPFEIERLVPHAEIVLKKNERFWNRDGVRLEGIHISIVPEAATALAMFERGELDWLGGGISPLPPDAIRELSRRGSLLYFPMAASTFCTLNVEAAPFSNIHIRRAFSLAIDRDEIANRLLETEHLAAKGYAPPALWGKSKLKGSLFDEESARAELALGLQELGLERLGAVALDFRAGITEKQVAQALQRQWKKTLGVEVELKPADFKRHKSLLHNRNYQIALTNWIAQYNDPMNLFERLKRQEQGKNYPGWENETFAALLDAAKMETDELERNGLLERAEEILLDEAPIAPIYHWNTPSLCGERVRNIKTTPGGGILFEQCWIDKN